MFATGGGRVGPHSDARAGDMVARYGGEEFAAVLQGDAGQASLIAERLRVEVEQLGIEHKGANTGVVTIRLGIATARPRHDVNPGALIARADEALYAAKRAGRNKVQVNEKALTS